MSKKGSKLDKKYDLLKDRLNEENPEISEEVSDFLREMERIWKKISPFVGEELAYGKLGINLDGDYKITAFPFDYILWFVLFKRVFGKFEKELEWFKENREILEKMVREYSEAQKLR